MVIDAFKQEIILVIYGNLEAIRDERGGLPWETRSTVKT